MAESFHSTDLAALHSVRREDGAFVAPSGSIVTLRPIGAFVELKIVVDGSTEVRAVLHRTALKVCRESQMRKDNGAW